MRVALVHDDFVQAGGAESLFATIATLWPKAPIYTSLVNYQKLPSNIDKNRIRSSWMQKIPYAAHFFKALLPLYPVSFESFDFSDFDLVISSTTRFSKSIITKPNTIHICYINNIPRFLWDKNQSEHYLVFPFNLLIKPLIIWLKRFDLVASSRVDHYIANSKSIQQKVQKYYRQDCNVIYPFVNFNLFRPPKIHNWQLKSQNFYLVVSRLVKWKRIDLAIKACLDLGTNLKIVGTGPDESRLKSTAKIKKESRVKVEFLGRVDPKDLVELYQNAQALIVTQEEDFGLSALEAQACGLAVIAYNKGGVAEIIIDKKTGVLFNKQNVESLADAIRASKDVKWKISEIVKNARRFSKSSFVKNLSNLTSLYARHSP